MTPHPHQDRFEGTLKHHAEDCARRARAAAQRAASLQDQPREQDEALEASRAALRDQQRADESLEALRVIHGELEVVHEALRAIPGRHAALARTDVETALLRMEKDLRG